MLGRGLRSTVSKREIEAGAAICRWREVNGSPCMEAIKPATLYATSYYDGFEFSRNHFRLEGVWI